MKTTIKLLIYLIILAVLDAVIPIPFTTILLIYVVVEKPPWFKNLVTDVYNRGNSDES